MSINVRSGDRAFDSRVRLCLAVETDRTPLKLVEGMIQPVQIGNRRKLVHLVAQCQEIRFAAIEGGDIEKA